MTEKQHNRRQILRAAAAVSLTGATASVAQDRRGSARASRKADLKLGLASYSLREFKLDEVLAMTKRVGLKHIAFKSMHLPLDSSAAQIREVAAKVKDAGLILYGCGVVPMKKAEQVHQAFDYARAAGMKIIIGVPAPELLGLVNEKVKKYDIRVAIHNHGPGDKTYPTPGVAYEKIKNLDKRIGLCNDIGHTLRYGVDPSRRNRYSEGHQEFEKDSVQGCGLAGVREGRQGSAGGPG